MDTESSRMHICSHARTLRVHVVDQRSFIVVLSNQRISSYPGSDARHITDAIRQYFCEPSLEIGLIFQIVHHMNVAYIKGPRPT